MTKNDLPSVVDIKRKAKLAGTRAYAYWASAIAPTIPSMPDYLRQVMYERAYEVSMNIIPTPTMDNVLFPALLKKPHRKTIEWNKLTREYGVDRRYIATAYLYALERFLSSADEATKARVNQRNAETNTSIALAIMSICVSGNMDRGYIAHLLGTNKFDTTLGGFDPQRIVEKAERAAARQARKDAGQKATANKYEVHITWAHWRGDRARRVHDRANMITSQLLDALAADPGLSPIRVLAALCTTVTLKRPLLAVTLAYAHAHVFPRLAQCGRWDVAETINAHAIQLAISTPSLHTDKRRSSRALIARLVGEAHARGIPNVPPRDQDSPRLTAIVDRCRAGGKNNLFDFHPIHAYNRV